MAGSYVRGIGTFENPQTTTQNWLGQREVNVGGTVRDSYGRDLLTPENKVGYNPNANQQLEAQRLEKREMKAPAAITTGKPMMNADVLIAKWQRGQALTQDERAFLKDYLMRQGYYSGDLNEGDDGEFNSFLSGYIAYLNGKKQKNASYQGASSSGTTTLSQPISVGGKEMKKTTDQSGYTGYVNKHLTSGGLRSDLVSRKTDKKSGGTSSSAVVKYYDANYN